MQFWVFAVVFLVGILIDVLGHRILKIKRSGLQWLLTVILLVGGLTTGYLGVRDLMVKGESDTSNLYFAIQYLKSGDTLQARNKINTNGVDSAGIGQVLSLFTECVEGDYLSAYFTAKQFVDKQGEKNKYLDTVLSIYELVKKELGIQSEIKDNIEQTNMEKRQQKIISEVNSGLNLIQRDVTYSDELDQLFRMEKEINTNVASEFNEEMMQSLFQKHEKDETFLRLAVKYEMYILNYEQAHLYAQKLIDIEKSPQNYVVYTDVIIQSAKNGFFFSDNSDLIDSSKCALNYLLSKKPLLGDNSGMYDLEIAKLYLEIGERGKAKEYVNKVIDKYGEIKADSPLYQPLEEVIEAYNQSEIDDTSPLLKGVVRNLVEAHSQDIIPINDNTINGTLTDFITSTLKYDHIGIHIGKVDTVDYPTVRAYANVNGTKEKMFGLVEEFTEPDFEILDTQYGIKDFKIVKENKSEQISIAVVMDNSGSMEGKPLEDAKLAAQACVKNMDQTNQDISIVAYSDEAVVMTPLSSEPLLLQDGISAVENGGGTNISAGITGGITELEGEAGTKAIILLSDGQDGNTKEAMDAAVKNAIKQNITIFAVGLGEVEESYMKNIAESTGGKFILADNTTELSDIYLTLQKYIINNYCFEYTVTKNPEKDPRKVIIGITKYQTSAQKMYSISGEAVEEDVYKADISFVEAGDLAVSSVVPGFVGTKDIEKGIEVTVNGYGFSKGVHISIGDLELSEVNIQSENILTGKLLGKMAAGTYLVRAELPDGRVDFKSDLFKVFRAGSGKSIRIGNNVINADVIGQTGDRNFVASGNVLINGFIHSNQDLNITAYNLPEDFKMEEKKCTALGKDGAISGTGKLYISYKQVKSNEVNQAEETFASLVMGGKDYIIRDGTFTIGIDGEETGFDTTLEKYGIEIPGIMKVSIVDYKLYSDHLTLNFNECNPIEIIKSVKEGLSNGEKSNDDAVDLANENAKGKTIFDKADQFDFDGLEVQASISVTAKDIVCGGSVKFKANDSLKFSAFYINDAELKLDTVDAKHEYWKIGGSIDFSHTVPGFKGALEGFGASISSYYWYPDKFEANINLNPGIPVYKVLFINKLGAKAEGVSNIFMPLEVNTRAEDKVLWGDKSLDSIKRKDVIIAGTLEADVNLFKTLGLTLPESMMKLGEMGAIKDGEIGLNFTEKFFYIKADLELLHNKIASAEMSLGKNGFEAKGDVNLAINIWDCEIAGGCNVELGVSQQSVVLGFGIEGKLKCPILNIAWDGEMGMKLSLEPDYVMFELSQNNRKSRMWYDNRGDVKLFNRFGASETI